MYSNRNDFLLSLQASMQDDGHCQFASDSDDNQLPEDFIAPLSHYGLLATEGPDSAKFLQGQTTCNLDDINDQQARLGAYCTAKGRMVSSFLAARRDDQHYLMRMRDDIVDATQSIFGKYIVFSKAEQQNLSQQTVIFGLHGPKAKARITAVFGSAPTARNQVLNHNGQLALQTDDDGLSFECWLELSTLDQFWPRLSDGLTLVGSRYWQLLTIRQGLGDISSPTVDEFIPQALNFPQVGAVSFDKGCYTGQEIVARMHYRGKAKRGLYRIQLTGSAPQVGQELYSDKEQAIGNLVNIVNTGTEQYEALAVLAHSEIDKPIRLAHNAEPITLLSLPYAVGGDTE